MRVLVTGAAGFVGRRVVASLRADDIGTVTTDKHDEVDLRGDLATPGFCESLPPVDAVVHCAAVQYVSTDLPLLNRKPWFERNNVEATTRLAARYATESSTYFLNVGTSMMYLQSGLARYSVTSPMGAQGPYSDTKLRAHRVVASGPNRSATVLPCIVGGPGRGGLFRNLVQMIHRSSRALVIGGGDLPVATVHVDDLAALIHRLVRMQPTGLFNAAAPDPLSIRQWIDIIGEVASKQRVSILSVPLAPVRLAATVTAHRLLAHEQVLMLRYPHVLDTRESEALGWVPQYSNERIVRDIARNLLAELAS